jgi:hypothetical protein
MSISPKSSTAALSATVLLALAGFGTDAHAQAPAPAQQITEAVQAAPPAQRADATVLGFRANGSVTTIRQGSNELVCLADDPTREGWSVACYHESLEPFMARGRELRAQGVTDSGELAQRRWAEADAGTLAMPEKPAMLYVMTGDGFDAASGTVGNGFLRWVIYSPWATPEETGLPTAPTGPGAPWLMFPGTAGAHIMITPPVPGGPGN